MNQILRLTALFFCLHLFLNLPRYFAHGLETWLLVPGPELPLLLAVILPLAAKRERWPWWVKVIPFILLSLVIIAAMAYNFVFNAWNRPLRLSDFFFVDDLIGLLAVTWGIPTWLALAMVVFLIFVIFLLALTAFVSTFTLLNRLHRVSPFKTKVSFALLLFMATCMIVASKNGASVLKTYLVALGKTDWQDIENSNNEAQFAGRLEEHHRLVQPFSQREGTLSGLKGFDVFIFVIESYGEITFGKEEFFEMVSPALAEFEKSIAGINYKALSKYYTSPVFGGASWMADTSFSCGFKIDNQWTYEKIFVSPVRCMEHFFSAEGYLTLGIRPGVRRPWEQGHKFYGYDKSYFYRDLDYEGPRYSWPPPTQYTLQYIYEQELKNRDDRPAFVKFVNVCSHWPWHTLPAYHDNWAEVTKHQGAIFASLPQIKATAGGHSFDNTHFGYTASIAYEFKVIGEFLKRYIKRPTVILIYGDHQPGGGIPTRGRSWAAPVHVVASDEAVLSTFRRMGFADGLVPQMTEVTPSFAAFLPEFLQAFSPEQTAMR